MLDNDKSAISIVFCWLMIKYEYIPFFRLLFSVSFLFVFNFYGFFLCGHSFPSASACSWTMIDFLTWLIFWSLPASYLVCISNSSICDWNRQINSDWTMEGGLGGQLVFAQVAFLQLGVTTVNGQTDVAWNSYDKMIIISISLFVGIDSTKKVEIV